MPSPYPRSTFILEDAGLSAPPFSPWTSIAPTSPRTMGGSEVHTQLTHHLLSTSLFFEFSSRLQRDPPGASPAQKPSSNKKETASHVKAKPRSDDPKPCSGGPRKQKKEEEVHEGKHGAEGGCESNVDLQKRLEKAEARAAQLEVACDEANRAHEAL